MKLDIIFLDKNKKWKRVIISGDFRGPSQYVWKSQVIKEPKDVDQVDDYVTLVKFLIYAYNDITPHYKEQIYKKVINYIKPYNINWIWVKNDGAL